MPYDPVLADRIRVVGRGLLGGELDDDDGDLGLVEEKKMFGGLGFMVAGHLAVCAGSKGDLMVRVDPADQDALDDRASARCAWPDAPRSWVDVDAATLTDDET